MNAVPRRLFAVLIAVAGMAVLAPGASASTEDIIAPSDPSEPKVDSGWQAGTCKEEPPESAQVCSVDTPDQFFETAAGHPNWGFTQFIVRSEPSLLPPPVGGPEEPIGEVKTVRVDLPVGLSVNPGATTRCPLATFETGASFCPPASKVGESAVTTAPAGHPQAPSPPLSQVPVYNVVPKAGEASRFGLELAGKEVFLEGDVAWEGDFHEGFTIHVPRSTELEPLITGLVLKNRLFFNGRAGNGTFITTPSTCLGEAFPGPSGHAYSTYLLASSYKEEEDPEYQFPADAQPPLESPIPPGTQPRECGTIPYDPGISLDPKTPTVDSPSGALTHVTSPFIEDPDDQETSVTREARLALPEGVGLNPSAAAGLKTCSDAQFAKGSRAPVTCPPESRIGIARIASPPLPEGILEGPVFVGTQLSRDPASGDEYRVFVDAESARYGISVRLLGRAVVDPVTGQITTIFSDLPQVPFSSFEVELDGGPHAVLTSPPICGPHKTVATMVPWSGNPPATPAGEFTLTSAPAGGSCPKTLAERPFAPSFAAASSNTQAGAFTDVSVDVGRSDGQQELKGVEVTLPPGITAKLAGLRYCPEAAISAAAANSGLAELAASSCPSDSLVGSAAVSAGSGPSPLQETGKAFLAGPYKGAPLSLAVITPATAGAFDLGTVVVRVALLVDRKTAQVTTKSDPLPHVYGGSLLDLRLVSVKIDRDGFSLNGTNCTPSSFAGTLRGGGANPRDPAAFTSVSASAPYQATGCDALPFGPKLFLRTFGATKRAKNPKLRAILLARPGDANIGRAAVTLPKSMILDQGAIGKVCTRVQFTANACPSTSIYGFAEATTPLLDGPLKGPVYLRSSDNTLPDLVADLHGQVDVELAGRTDSVRGRIRNTFDAVPDVPVSRFILTIRGGKKKGLLVNSQNLCARRQLAKLNLTAQNGKKVTKKKLKVRTPCKKKKKKKRHGARAGR